MTGEIGTVYTLHLDRPIGPAGNSKNQARHYTGWARGDGTARIAHHRNGTSGAKLMDYAHSVGIGFTVATTEPGTRDRERQLKQRAATRRCPLCVSS